VIGLGAVIFKGILAVFYAAKGFRGFVVYFVCNCRCTMLRVRAARITKVCVLQPAAHLSTAFPAHAGTYAAVGMVAKVPAGCQIRWALNGRLHLLPGFMRMCRCRLLAADGQPARADDGSDVQV
jgi:hypothetical protein